MSEEKVTVVETVASEKKEEAKKSAPQKKEETKTTTAVKSSCDCEEKLQKLILALCESSPSLARNIKHLLEGEK